MDEKRLAAELRKEAEGANWGAAVEALKRVADALERTAEPEPTQAERWVADSYTMPLGKHFKPAEPAVHWSRWFTHSGKESPVPLETEVEFYGADDGPMPALHWDWSDLTGEEFRYAADNKGGWLPRPEGWVPPDEAWPLEWKVRQTLAQHEPQTGRRELLAYEWPGVTHIRLLPREAKPATCDTLGELVKAYDRLVDDDVLPATPPPPAVVRGALEQCERYFASGDSDGYAFDDCHGMVNLALAALDAREPETLPEWAFVDGKGDLAVKQTVTRIHWVLGNTTPDDLDRISEATRIWAAQLRREGK